MTVIGNIDKSYPVLAIVMNKTIFVGLTMAVTVLGLLVVPSVPTNAFAQHSDFVYFEDQGLIGQSSFTHTSDTGKKPSIVDDIDACPYPTCL